MPSFELADGDVHARVQDLLRRHHKPLHEAKVTVCCLLAHAPADGNGDAVGTALKLHGRACAGIIRVTSHRDRVAGHKDAMMLLDGDRWPTWSERQQDALLDHELTHLQLVTNAKEEVLRDSVFRPRLKLRLHDWEITGFEEIVQRYGSDSFEHMEAQLLFEKHGQLLFPWATQRDRNLFHNN